MLLYPDVARVPVRPAWIPGEVPDCLTPVGGPARRLECSLALFMAFGMIMRASFSLNGLYALFKPD
jgi:hypothetical protein